MLTGSLEPNRAKSVDNCIDHQRQHRAGQDRQQRVGHFEKRADDRHRKFTAEKRGEISGDQRNKARQLAGNAKSPATQDLKQDQEDSE